ncbi:MAG: YbbR-like domain-containing protein [Prevotella sp.]|nr:YbbR-like domain-containing protein [Prevotella sp.]
MKRLRTALRAIRNFLFSKANREFLIFLFFLTLSGVFWLLMTLNETYEKELAIPLRIVNVPKDIVLTSNETDTLKVTVRDRGIVLFAYLYGDAAPAISVNFKTYDRGNGTGTMQVSELTRLLNSRLNSSTKIMAIKPDRYTYYYNTGASKRIPVRWSGRVIPEHLYFLSEVIYSPDSVTVYASEEKLDSIHIAYTEQLNYVGFRDTLNVDCRLRRSEGVKLVPDRVKIAFVTDVLTEESIDNVPIEGINMPPGKVLRTFPAKVKVQFVTGVNVYRTLSPNDFTVVADYNELKSLSSDKCNIYLRKVPEGISRATLSIQQVDYLIEELPTE